MLQARRGRIGTVDKSPQDDLGDPLRIAHPRTGYDLRPQQSGKVQDRDGRAGPDTVATGLVR